MKRPGVLLLSGGGHTGANILAALGDRRSGLRLVAMSDVADEPALLRFDAAYLAPRLAEQAERFEERVLDILERERIDVVIPCRDEDAWWLAGFAARHPALAPRLLCGSVAAAEVALDKWLAHEFCRREGLPYAPSFPTGEAVGGEAFFARAGLPLVFKPRRGANAAGIRLLVTLAQARAALQEPDGVLQQYLGDGQAVTVFLDSLGSSGVPLEHSFMGDKRSIQVMIGPRGEVANVACTRNLMSGRISRRISIDPDPAARAIGLDCATAFARLGWRGPLNIQCQPAADGQLLIHEFNARFTGATAARRLLGIDEVALALRLFIGAVLPPSNEPAAVPQTALESLSARAGDPCALAILDAEGVWRAPGPEAPC